MNKQSTFDSVCTHCTRMHTALPISCHGRPAVYTLLALTFFLRSLSLPCTLLQAAETRNHRVLNSGQGSRSFGGGAEIDSRGQRLTFRGTVNNILEGDFTSDSLFSLCISQTVSCICGTTKEERLRGGGFYIEVNAGISGRVLSIDPL